MWIGAAKGRGSLETANKSLAIPEVDALYPFRCVMYCGPLWRFSKAELWLFIFWSLKGFFPPEIMFI